MGFGGIINFLIFEKIEQIIKEKGVEAYGIGKKVYNKIRALQCSLPKMEQFCRVILFFSHLYYILQTAE